MNTVRSVIEAFFREKGWRGARIVIKFPGKKLSMKGINRLVKKIEDTGSASRQSGSGRPRRACTDENKGNVEDLSGTHHPQRKIARELGVHNMIVDK